MFKNLKVIIINHIGLIIFTVIIIISLYFIFTQVIDRTSISTDEISTLSSVLDNNTSRTYDNTILTGSQVLSTIERYYNKEDMMILLLNNPKDYNHASYRFWVTERNGKYGQNTNYENKIISSSYTNITTLLIQEKSINNKNDKKSLDSYKDPNNKNYIGVSNKYKSILLKCNDLTLGIAFLAIQ